ncbi:MAG: hypothetical protein J5729_05295 [Bacteroidaceae bacterium]|nr:hypothetical protein [Bacteroidaceae bacterium]MBO4592789.1 hypothetical protein [Bacteroidaceae bacterium]MBR4782427.1 hypothetical protein [Bacteroidaceae bacterium]
MKKIKFFAIAAMAVLMMSCGSKPYDEGTVNDLREKVFSLTPEDYPEVVKQVDGILTYFEQKYTAEEIKENDRKVMMGEDGFGSDTELFKTMNLLDSALTGMDDQMDEATKKAYDKYQERRKALRAF